MVFHSEGHPERFTELQRKNKREEGDRVDLEEMRGNQKGREQPSQYSIPCVLSTAWNTKRGSQNFVEKTRGEKEIDVTWRRKGGGSKGERQV